MNATRNVKKKITLVTLAYGSRATPYTITGFFFEKLYGGFINEGQSKCSVDDSCSASSCVQLQTLSF